MIIEEEAIHNLLRQGFTPKETADKLGIPKSLVYTHVPSDVTLRSRTKVIKVGKQIKPHGKTQIKNQNKINSSPNKNGSETETEFERLKRLSSGVLAEYPESKPHVHKRSSSKSNVTSKRDP